MQKGNLTFATVSSVGVTDFAFKLSHDFCVIPSMALLMGHLGLGDQLACCGLVRTLAESEKNVVVVCKQVTVPSLKFLYKNVPNIHLLPVENDSAISPRFGSDPHILWAFTQLGFRPLLLGLHQGPLAAGSGFVDTFYGQANVSKARRYDSFHVDRDLCMEQRFSRQPKGDYLFVHDDASRGFCINLDTQIPIVRPGKADERPFSDNVFAFIGLMQGAVELHLFDSAFSHLADLLDILPGRRYLHANVKNPEDRVEDLFLRPGWIFLR